uniref:Uncharacterized protein n=1 Tax=Schistocephalus solidus TaxID=70667 RepID=A0A0X3NNZ5_SCHSO
MLNYPALPLSLSRLPLLPPSRRLPRMPTYRTVVSLDDFPCDGDAISAVVVVTGVSKSLAPRAVIGSPISLLDHVPNHDFASVILPPLSFHLSLSQSLSIPLVCFFTILSYQHIFTAPLPH